MMSIIDPFLPLRTIFTASRTNGFSLVEILVVMGVISLLLALSVPSMVSIAPVRKSALYEVKGFLEYARAEAVARDREVYIAFADKNFPGRLAPYRSYAAFAAVGESRDGLIRSQEIAQISEWRTLPEGAVFVSGNEFEVVEGARLQTVIDSTFTREFAVRGETGTRSVQLPFLLFSPSGRVLVPSYFDADALHVGIAEGYFDRQISAMPILTAMRPGINNDGEYAQAECLAIEYYTGRSRAITD